MKIGANFLDGIVRCSNHLLRIVIHSKIMPNSRRTFARADEHLIYRPVHLIPTIYQQNYFRRFNFSITYKNVTHISRKFWDMVKRVFFKKSVLSIILNCKTSR